MVDQLWLRVFFSLLAHSSGGQELISLKFWDRDLLPLVSVLLIFLILLNLVNTHFDGDL